MSETDDDRLERVSKRRKKKIYLDSDDEGNSDTEMPDVADEPSDQLVESSHNSLLRTVKATVATVSKRKKLKEADEDIDVFNEAGKLIVKTQGLSTPTNILDWFDEKDTNYMNELQEMVKPCKKVKKKGQKQESISLTTTLKTPEVNKIKREILYENTKKDVSKWNSVVYHNRSADQLVFPLPNRNEIEIKTKAESNFVPMTPLEVDLAKLIHGEGYVQQRRDAVLGKKSTVNDEEAYARTVENTLEQHHEMARLRALQSYEMAKAKRRGKIKSKTYHRLQRREKIRKQLKEFEEMQKTDPAAALVKLEELNQARLEERMTLKHRNTSKWAKANTIRAKYNRESRIELAEQLKLSKALTQKVVESSDESDPDDIDLEIPDLVKSSLENPWCLSRGVQENDKVNMYYTGYRKFWDEVNARKERERKRAEREEIRQKEEADKTALKKKETEERIRRQRKEADEVKKPIEAKPSKKKKKQKKLREVKVEAPLVKADEVPDDLNVDDLDDLLALAEEKMRQKVAKDVKSLKTRNNKKVVEEVSETINEIRVNTDGDIDEIRDLEVDEVEVNFEGINADDNQEEASSNLHMEAKKSVETPPDTSKPKVQGKLIDPSHFLEIRKSALYNMNETNLEDEDEAEREHLKLISEVFEDDDLLKEFEERKTEVIEGSKPKDIDLTLPGWGEWYGKGMEINKKKKRRFIKKAPVPPPRKDSSMPHVILNEGANVKINQLQVKELPFPYKNVATYEKVIRAPIGRTWMPEQAMKDLIAPRIITKLGSTIKPIGDELLLKKSKSRNLKIR